MLYPGRIDGHRAFGRVVVEQEEVSFVSTINMLESDFDMHLINVGRLGRTLGMEERIGGCFC